MERGNLVKPLGRLAKFADKMMVPAMYALSGTFKESPQRTHRWNNMHLDWNADDLFENLRRQEMLYFSGVLGAMSPKIPLLFHIPILGGWRNYVVLQPSTHDGEWFVGWASNHAVGVSRIPIRGPVRMLLGPMGVYFFGISAGDQKQIKIEVIGTGRIWKGGPHAQVPLL